MRLTVKSANFGGLAVLRHPIIDPQRWQMRKRAAKFRKKEERVEAANNPSFFWGKMHIQASSQITAAPAIS